MRNIIAALLVVTLFTLSGASRAQGDFTVSYHSTYKSSYVGGNGVRFHDGPVIQNGVTVSRKGSYAFIWVSTPLDSGWNEDFGSEFNVGFGHDFALSKAYRCDLGYSYYDLTPLERLRGDLHAVSANIYTTGRGLRPFVRFEYDIAQTLSVLPGGLTYKVGTSYRIPKGPQLQFVLLGHGPAFGKPAEFISALQTSAAASFKLAGVPVTAGVMVQRRLGRPLTSGGITRNEVVFWVSTSF